MLFQSGEQGNSGMRGIKIRNREERHSQSQFIDFRSSLWYNVGREKCDSISRLRRRKRPAENSAGRPRYTDNGGKMPTGIFGCAAGKGRQRTRSGGRGTPTTAGKCQQAFSIAPPVDAGRESGRAAQRFPVSISPAKTRRISTAGNNITTLGKDRTP